MRVTWRGRRLVAIRPELGTGRVRGKVPGTRAGGVEGVEPASPGLRPVRVACCSLLVGRAA
jgi:hypothetical protein